MFGSYKRSTTNLLTFVVQRLEVPLQHNSCLCTENQIYKGLDDDESTFLNFVAERQAEMEAQQFEEEMEELKEYRISSSTAASNGRLCMQCGQYVCMYVGIRRFV